MWTLGHLLGISDVPLTLDLGLTGLISLLFKVLSIMVHVVKALLFPESCTDVRIGP